MGGGGGGRLFEAGRLLTFSVFRMGAYTKWALIRGWALIRINSVTVSRSKAVSKLFFPDFLRAQNTVRASEGKLYKNDLRGNKNYFELAGGSSYRGFELPRVKLQ